MTPRVRALAFHVRYHCRHSGACCSAGWDIPVEPQIEDLLRTAMREGRLARPAGALAREALRAVEGLPHGARTVLRTVDGRCVFLETGRVNLCSVHRQIGEHALTTACRQFPRVALLRPDGVDVTLSHFCPTAAAALFDEPVADAPGGEPTTSEPDLACRIEVHPPSFPDSFPYEGLDARHSWPPLLRPGVLMAWSDHDVWLAHVVGVLSRSQSPEDALDRLAADAERVRAWRPEACGLASHLSSVASGSGDVPAFPDSEDPLGAWDLVAHTIPSRHRPARPALEQHLDAARQRALVTDGWLSMGRPLRRWLAARAFGSWLSLQGQGVRTSVRGLRVALGVVRAEAERGCIEAGRALDRTLLEAAIRRADLLLVHLSDPEALAVTLSRGERATTKRVSQSSSRT